jgi:histidyl-tRNA synthetase
MKKLSTKPYKGTRDFYPEDQFIQNYIFSHMRDIVERFGYTEYNASILEETNLYKAKTGEEIVNEQTYSFKDRGKRDVTIRPEMTPTIARMVAQKRKDLAFPLRWYSIPNLMRYERPQRGRLREHWQLNVDIFGVDSLFAEVEIIKVAHTIMLEFGAKPKNFVIKLNNRHLINSIMQDYLSLNKTQAHKLGKLIDRKNKIKPSQFNKELKLIVHDKTAKTKRLLDTKSLRDLPKDLSDTKGARDLRQLMRFLKAQKVNNIEFDITLMRGFDYYTGTVFEVFDTHPNNNRALFGGGRYDDLVDIFGVEKVTGLGFGMGDVTMRDFLETYSLLPEYKSQTDLYICTFNETFIDEALELANYLREQEIRVAVNITNKKIGHQIKTADKLGIPYILCIGEEEVKSGKYKIKNLRTRKEKSVSKSGIKRIVNGN